MNPLSSPKFAARLNAFKINAQNYWPGKNKVTTIDLLKRASTAGLTAAELNYPDHFVDISEKELKETLEATAMTLNGAAMRYYTNKSFKLGAFTNPDRTVRRMAIDETKKGIDAVSSLGGKMMTLWMGQDGVDYSFQADYSSIWEWTIEAIIEVADHNKKIDISLEYKPNEPRGFSLMPDASTTLLALIEIDRDNTGVTLDFAHMLYADELPAFSANLIARHSKILGVHLNDGYGKWDNGLMAGSIHPIQTVELLVELKRLAYEGIIYFDTFPDHTGLDPVIESRTNIENVKRFMNLADKLSANEDLKQAISTQNAARSMQIVQTAMIR